MEKRKTIPSFPMYEITTSGKIWSKKHHKYLQFNKQRGKYLLVDLWNGKRFPCKVHRLVLETYIGPCPRGMECRHLNGNPSDNRLENLKWGTRSENMQDAVRHGTIGKSSLGKFGEEHPSSKLSDADRRLIFSAYHDGAYTQQELADLFGVSQHCTKTIVNNEKWACYSNGG